VSQEKNTMHPTTNDNFSDSCPIPAIFVQILLSKYAIEKSFNVPRHLLNVRRPTYTLGNFKMLKITNLASNCRHPLCFHCCVEIENGYDRVDLCRPWNESQRPVLPRCLKAKFYYAILLANQLASWSATC